MKYAVIKAPTKLVIEEKTLPPAERDQVLVHVAACGICGSDVRIFRGDMPYRFPYSPGHEYSGLVIEVGW